MEHTKIFGADKSGRPQRSMRRALSFWRRASKWPMAGGAIGEGGCCATEDELLSLGITDDNGIVMTAITGHVRAFFK